MAKLVKMQTVDIPTYDGQDGMDVNGEWLTLVTNIQDFDIEKYRQLIRSFNSHCIFGLHDVAYGFYEDEGYSFITSGYGLYISNRNKLPDFWKHVKKMEHVHKYKPGYKPGFVSYRMLPVTRSKRNPHVPTWLLSIL